MRDGCYLYNCGAYRQPCAGREILAAEVEVDEELIAGQRDTFAMPSDEFGEAVVHDIELHFRVAFAVGRP